jgi:hypothetical protein
MDHEILPPGSLQKIIADELERRMKTSKSRAEALRGYDDFCREQTAKFMFNNPEMASDWISVRTHALTEALEVAKSESDYHSWLTSFSARNPLDRATSMWDKYAFIPPTLKPKKTWANLIQKFSFEPETCEYLFNNGFMPVHANDIEKALYFTLNLNGKYHGPKPHFRYALMDTDYGIAILPPGSPKKSTTLDISLLVNYITKMPLIAQTPSLIFDIGALRAFQILHGRFTENPNIIHAEVSTRAELDEFIGGFLEKSAVHGQFQLWYRGQPNEYLLPDLRRKAKTGIFPWRELQDISQVPSLYRNQVERISNLHSYCQRLLEFQKYYLFIKETLGVPNFATRSPNELISEKLPKTWNNGSLKISMEFRIQGETGEFEPVEFHDHDNTFRGLQEGLFLQHYGLESNILDLTSDIDVALFFAQKKVVNNRYVDVDFSKENPVIYILILDDDIDPVVNTPHLLESFDLLRPKRQNCGILAGASLANKNFYSRFIGLKITLKQKIEMKYEDPNYLFPSPKEDKFLSNLIEFSNLQNMSYIKPFVLEQ